ncbi:MAG: SGNH/GDSL hydrolase family protein [Bacteroidia bacterium]
MKIIATLLTTALCFNTPKQPPINYIAFGDSYTICTGTTRVAEQWPTVLTEHLVGAGINVKLVANPARNGYTTQNLIDKELPLLKTNNLDFATLLIGVNDWVQGVDSTTFKRNFTFIVDELQHKIANKKNIIIVTIPDFSATPQGAMYGAGRNITKGIASFNTIIKTVAAQKGLTVVDIFATTQAMKNKKELIAADELHPSALEYSLWEKLIFTQAKQLLGTK